VVDKWLVEDDGTDVRGENAEVNWTAFSRMYTSTHCCIGGKCMPLFCAVFLIYCTVVQT